MCVTCAHVWIVLHSILKISLFPLLTKWYVSGENSTAKKPNAKNDMEFTVVLCMKFGCAFNNISVH